MIGDRSNVDKRKKIRNEFMKSEREITEADTADKLSFDVAGYLKDLSYKWAAVVIFLVLWELLPTVGLLDPKFIPAPSTIALATWGMLFTNNDFLMNTLISLSRVFVGFGLALLVAIPSGFLLGGYFKNLEKAINPLLQLFGQINPWSFLHILIIFLGFGGLSIIFVIFYIALWPVLFNTVTGVKNGDPIFIRIGKVSGWSDFGVFWKVQLPAAMPTVFTGMRLAAILSFFMVIGAEMMGAGDGLGYYIMLNEMYGQIPQMWGCIVTMSLLGIVFVYVLLQLEKYFVDWKEDILPYNPEMDTN